MNNKFFKILIVSIFFISFLSVFVFDLGQFLSFANIKNSQISLQNSINENYYFYYAVFFVIYIIITAFALPFAAIKTILAGVMFGLIPGVLLTSFASSIGSTLCFLMSRFVLRNYVENKYQKYVDRVNLGISKDRVYAVQRRDKKHFAKSSDGRPNILIDDHQNNIQEFKSAGGIAIHHTSASSSIAELEKIGF